MRRWSGRALRYLPAAHAGPAARLPCAARGRRPALPHAALAAFRKARRLRHLTSQARRRAIGAIVEARFSIAAFEKIRRADPAYWSSPRNEMGRGIYGEAMREKQRLNTVSDAQLQAETRAIESGFA